MLVHPLLIKEVEGVESKWEGLVNCSTLSRPPLSHDSPVYALHASRECARALSNKVLKVQCFPSRLRKMPPILLSVFHNMREELCVCARARHLYRVRWVWSWKNFCWHLIDNFRLTNGLWGIYTNSPPARDVSLILFWLFCCSLLTHWHNSCCSACSAVTGKQEEAKYEAKVAPIKH